MALTSTEEALVRQLLNQQAAILSLAWNEATITSKLGATKVTLSDLTLAGSLSNSDLFLVRQGTQDKSLLASTLHDYFFADLSGILQSDVRIGFGDNKVWAFGRNAENAGADYQGLQIGGGEPSYGADGVLLGNDGHASWLRLQPSKNESPVEMLLYGTAAQGQASGASGTNQVSRITGTPFTSAWIGKKFYLGSTVYKVSSVTNTDLLVVTTEAGGAVSFSSTFTETFHVFYVKGQGTCSVSGGVVTRTQGDPFVPFITSPYVFRLNGTTYTVTAFMSVNTQTISGAPPDGNYTYTFETDINNQLATLRIQKLIGGDEENLSIYADHKGYHLRSFFAGQGRLRPVFVGNSGYSQFIAHPNGDATIGGDYGAEAIRVIAPAGTIANRLEVQAAAPGLAPAWRARGSDSNVGMVIDTQGASTVTFTSHSFTNIEFEVFGIGGTTWLAAGSSSSDTPTLSANGPSANIDIKLNTKGSGVVWLNNWISTGDQAINGYVYVKDNTGTLRRLATIA